MNRAEPSSRTLPALVAILMLIAALAGLVASLAQFVGQWPALVQALFYLVMGLAWIFPALPILRWARTGRFKAGSPAPLSNQD